VTCHTTFYLLKKGVEVVLFNILQGGYVSSLGVRLLWEMPHDDNLLGTRCSLPRHICGVTF